MPSCPNFCALIAALFLLASVFAESLTQHPVGRISKHSRGVRARKAAGDRIQQRRARLSNHNPDNQLHVINDPHLTHESHDPADSKTRYERPLQPQQQLSAGAIDRRHRNDQENNKENVVDPDRLDISMRSHLYVRANAEKGACITSDIHSFHIVSQDDRRDRIEINPCTQSDSRQTAMKTTPATVSAPTLLIDVKPSDRDLPSAAERSTHTADEQWNTNIQTHTTATPPVSSAAHLTETAVFVEDTTNQHNNSPTKPLLISSFNDYPVANSLSPSLSTTTPTSASSRLSTHSSPPAPLPQQAQINRAAVLSPADLVEQMSMEGVKRCREPFPQHFWKAVSAGFFIGIGGMLSCSIGGVYSFSPSSPSASPSASASVSALLASASAFPNSWAVGHGMSKVLFGAFGFPLAIAMVTLTGSSAFTGNLALVGAALVTGKLRLRDSIKMQAATYLGCVVGAGLSGALAACADLPAAIPTIFISAKKIQLSASSTFFRGVAGGYLIAMGSILGFSSMRGGGTFSDVFLSIWAPISGYAMLDLEHSLANVFFFTAAICKQAVSIAPVAAVNAGFASGVWPSMTRNSICGIAKNMLFSTAGNIVGALVMAGMLLLRAVNPSATNPVSSPHGSRDLCNKQQPR